MGKYAIITDSASDLSKEYRQANNIDYAKTSYSYEENGQLHELAADLDWENISCKDFYDVLMTIFRKRFRPKKKKWIKNKIAKI